MPTGQRHEERMQRKLISAPERVTGEKSADAQELGKRGTDNSNALRRVAVNENQKSTSFLFK